MSLLSASINGPQSVASESFVDIDGLKLTLPPASSKLHSALILLNVPMPYAEGSDSPEIIFNIDCNGRSIARRGFGSDDGILPLMNMKKEPFTLVVKVPLRNGAESLVHAQWAGVHGSKGRINSFASISAIVE